MATRPEVTVGSPRLARRFFNLPARLVTGTRPSSRTAIPAESYPRYSRRARPWRARSTGREEGAAACGPAYPTIPHMPLTVSTAAPRSEEHTSELQSRFDLVCRLLLEQK